MEGSKDPFNRRTYPWNRTDQRQQEALMYFRRVARIRTENACLRTGYYKTLYANGGTFAFVRYLKEGRDAFGKEASGSRAVVFVMNRSDKPVYVDISEHYGEYNCKPSGDDGEIHPLSEQFVLGGILGGTRKIGIRPFGSAFLVY
jgi:4-alpha-glucanotransferase